MPGCIRSFVPLQETFQLESTGQSPKSLQHPRWVSSLCFSVGLTAECRGLCWHVDGHTNPGWAPGSRGAQSQWTPGLWFLGSPAGNGWMGNSWARPGQAGEWALLWPHLCSLMAMSVTNPRTRPSCVNCGSKQVAFHCSCDLWIHSLVAHF